MIKRKYIELTGILTGMPENDIRPFGKYVYQRTRAGHGNIAGDASKRQQVRIWVRGTMRNTPAQQPYRARFALGVAAWHAMTNAQKEVYRVPGQKLGLNRFQLFMREWNLTHTTPTASVWDAGASTWDSGATTWPLPE